MRIQHNISALNGNRNLQLNQNKTSKTLEKLSSGYKINRSGDDAAGLAISEKMRGQIRGLNMAGKNIQDGISLIQTAEGAINEIHSLLQRGRELSVQSANDTNTDDDRVHLQKEIEQIKNEINRIGNDTEFNTRKLLDGALSGVQSAPIQSNAKVTGQGAREITVEDGWVDFGFDMTSPHKIKMNEGESVIDDPSQWLFTKFNFNVYYDSTGEPKHLNVYSVPEGYVITSNNPNLVFSYNGITIDASSRRLTNGSWGDQPQGSIELSAGVNNLPTTTPSDGLIFQIGANEGQNIKLNIDDVRSGSIGISGVNISTQQGSNLAISQFDNAIVKVSNTRSKLGAMQNRLEHSFNSVTNTSENLQAAESRIRDTDMAKEMMEFTKMNILKQASQSMLANSNQQSQSILQLLQ